MKNLFTVMFLVLSTSMVFSQEAVAKPALKVPNITFAPNLIGPLFGIYGADINFKSTENIAIDTELGYFNIKSSPLFGSLIAEKTNFWFGNVKVGPTLYFDKSFHGLFVGGYVKGAYFTVGDAVNNFSAAAMGAGAKAGWRGTWDWFSLALGGGYEYNKAFADVKSTDSTVTAQLSTIQGGYPYAVFKMEIALY